MIFPLCPRFFKRCWYKILQSSLYYCCYGSLSVGLEHPPGAARRAPKGLSSYKHARQSLCRGAATNPVLEVLPVTSHGRFRRRAGCAAGVRRMLGSISSLFSEMPP